MAKEGYVSPSCTRYDSVAPPAESTSPGRAGTAAGPAGGFGVFEGFVSGPSAEATGEVVGAVPEDGEVSAVGGLGGLELGEASA